MAMALLLTSTNGSFADSRPATYIIYDSSNSMWGALPDRSRKYEAARAAMRDLAGQDFGDRDVALRMYGHRRKDDCTDSELVVPFSSPAAVGDAMIAAMEDVRPTGRTPIDLSLRAALKDFGDRTGSIILISDGIESCDADPCALVREWKDRDIDITVHVVGLGLKGKERAAMQCIADAAGTAYRDAFSTGELIDSIGAAIEQASTGGAIAPGVPDPTEQPAGPEFKLVVTTDDGVRQRGAGTLVSSAGGEPIPVETFRRHTPNPGNYRLEAGVTVVGGEIYRPVSAGVVVSDNERSVGSVVAPRPPEVSASFSMEGEALRASVVTVYRDGQKLGSFKGDETAFVPEGVLEFRAKPPGTSQELVVTESFAAGDSKTVSFEAATEVHVTIVATATATGTLILSKPTTDFYRNDEEIASVNSRSGGLVVPGEYEIRIDDGLNLFRTNVAVSGNRQQIIEFPVPSGAVTVAYQDADGRAEKQKRVFIERLSDGRQAVRRSGEPIPLVPGRYIVTGHPKAAGYPPQEIEIAQGSEHTITLRATK